MLRTLENPIVVIDGATSQTPETHPGLVTAMKGAFRDKFEYVTKNPEEFINAAKLFGANRRDVVVDISDVQFKPMPETPMDLQLLIETQYDLWDGADRLFEAMEDSRESGTRFYIEINEDVFPLRDTARTSILERVGIGGAALDLIPRELLAQHLNEYASRRDIKGKVILNNGKVEAILGEKYRLIPAETVMESAGRYFEEEGGEFVSGGFTHTRSDAIWSMGMVNVDIPIDTGLNRVLFEKRIRVSTSDSANMAVTIVPEMRTIGDKVGLSYCLPLQVVHKGDASIEIVEKQLALVSKRLEDSVATILRLSDIALVNPANVFLALLKWLKVPAKYGAEVFERRKAMWAYSDHTAWEVYGALSEVLTQIYEESPKMRVIAEYQERFARGLSFDFIGNDIPGEFTYSDRLQGVKGV